MYLSKGKCREKQHSNEQSSSDAQEREMDGFKPTTAKRNECNATA